MRSHLEPAQRELVEGPGAEPLQHLAARAAPWDAMMITTPSSCRLCRDEARHPLYEIAGCAAHPAGAMQEASFGRGAGEAEERLDGARASACVVAGM